LRFSRPDVLSDPTGEALADGDVREALSELRVTLVRHARFAL